MYILVLRAAREPAAARERDGTGVFTPKGFSYHVY